MSYRSGPRRKRTAEKVLKRQFTGASHVRHSAVTEGEALHASIGRIDSPPLSPTALRGKVVPVASTYTRVNWLRTLPHVRSRAAP